MVQNTDACDTRGAGSSPVFPTISKSMRERLSSYDKKISKLQRELKFRGIFSSRSILKIKESLIHWDAKRWELREKMKSIKRFKV